MGQISRWERGDVVPYSETLARIWAVLGVEDPGKHPPIGGSLKSEARYRVREITRHSEKLTDLLGDENE